MREPFSRVLPRDEPLRAAGECDLAVTAGPLAGLAEVLAFFSPVLSIILALRLEAWPAKAVGLVLPPLVAFVLARYPLRRWGRPRQWIGVTTRRLLIWRRPPGLRAEPRIESIPLSAVAGVELERDAWDRRAGTHQLVVHLADGAVRDLGRVHHGERLREAIQSAASALRTLPGPPEFKPPAAPPTDYRPR
ncbi:MAG: hypothetical protein C4290_07435 [Chloroflexota bacterium]